MCTINISICHDDNFGVSEFFEGEFFSTNTCSQCRNDVNNLGVFEYFVKPRFVYINAFTFKGKDGLILPISSLLSSSAGGISLHEEKFRSGRVTFRAVSKFSRHWGRVENTFATNHFSGTASGFACSRSINGFLDDTFGDGRILFQQHFKLSTSETLNDTFNLCVSKFGLRLSFKLRVGNFDADDCSHSFSDVFTREVYFCIFQEIISGGIRFESSGESTLKTTLVEPTFSGTDVIGIGTDVFCVSGIELKRDLYRNFWLNPLYVDGFRMEDLFVLVVVGNEGGKSTFILKGNWFRIFLITFIVKFDEDTFVEKGKFSETVAERVVWEVEGVKYFGIRHKCCLGTGFFASACFFYGCLWNAALVALFINIAVLLDLDMQPFGKSVDAGGADAV